MLQILSNYRAQKFCLTVPNSNFKEHVFLSRVHPLKKTTLFIGYLSAIFILPAMHFVFPTKFFSTIVYYSQVRLKRIVYAKFCGKNKMHCRLFESLSLFQFYHPKLIQPGNLRLWCSLHEVGAPRSICCQ